MSTMRALKTLAGVIHAAQQLGRKTPMGIAFAIDSAGLLMSPETAAELADLRVLADEYRPADEDPITFALTKKGAELEPARCGRALSTGQPCPEHDDFVFSTLIADHKDPATASRALTIYRADVLREAADAVWPHYGAAAVRLRRMADEVGKDTLAGATSTRFPLPRAVDSASRLRRLFTRSDGGDQS